MKLVRISKDNYLSINNTNIKKIKELYKELVYFFIEEIKKGDISSLKMILNGNDYLGKIIIRLVLGMYTSIRCGAGKTKISVTANGDIFPCDSFVGIEKYKLSNIENMKEQLNNLNNEFFSLSVNNREKCIKCWAKYICGGDCPYNSFLCNNNIYEPDKYFCEIQKYLIELSIHLVYILAQDDKLMNEIRQFARLREYREVKELKEI